MTTGQGSAGLGVVMECQVLGEREFKLLFFTTQELRPMAEHTEEKPQNYAHNTLLLWVETRTREKAF